MTAPAPVWLQPADVSAWLRLPAGQDEDLILSVSAAVEPEVERSRPDMWYQPPIDPDVPDVVPPRVYQPDAEVYQGATMLAAKVYRRRNSPGGIIEGFGDNVAYVARYDPEVQRALHQGAWSMPGVG